MRSVKKKYSEAELKGGVLTKYSIKSDKGKVRPSNQDSCFLTVFDDNSCFAVVCDGMGGPNAGDVAADIAIKNISQRFVAGWRKGITAESVINLLTTAITAANICVYDASVSDEELNGMGTTAVAAVSLGNTLITAHIGDSRAYILDSQLKQITKDHSLVQELLDSGELSADDEKKYPYKNVITRALGVDESVEIEFNELVLSGNEKILLCSDGLTNYVDDAEISDIMKSHDTEKLAEILVETANSNGGGDNVTAVVFSDN